MKFLKENHLLIKYVQIHLSFVNHQTLKLCTFKSRQNYLLKSNMSAHVLLNLLSELGKRDKMRGLSSILSHFRNEFNKFNNTRARMLDSIYHMTLRLL